MLQRVARTAAKRITAEEAAGLVTSGMWLDYGAVLGQPDVFDAALALRRDELTGVKIRACLSVRPRAVLEADPHGAAFHWVNLHFSGYDRKKHDAGRSTYMPVNLGEIPDYYRRFIRSGGHPRHQGPADGRRRQLQSQRRATWHRGDHRAGAHGDHRGHTRPCPSAMGAETVGPCLRGRLRDRGRQCAAAELPNSAADRGRPAVARLIAGRDRGRRLPADRHRRHAERGVQRCCGTAARRTSASIPRC